MKILSLYLTLKKNPSIPFTPTAFLFAGKAAASYHLAKVTLEFIRALEVLVNSDPDVNDKMRVAFIEDFDVTKAEIIYAAADCSVWSWSIAATSGRSISNNPAIHFSDFPRCIKLYTGDFSPLHKNPCREMQHLRLP